MGQAESPYPRQYQATDLPGRAFALEFRSRQGILPRTWQSTPGILYSTRLAIDPLDIAQHRLPKAGTGPLRGRPTRGDHEESWEETRLYRDEDPDASRGSKQYFLDRKDTLEFDEEENLSKARFEGHFAKIFRCAAARLPQGSECWTARIWIHDAVPERP